MEYNRREALPIEKGEAGGGEMKGRKRKKTRTGDNGHLPVEAQGVGHP